MIHTERYEEDCTVIQPLLSVLIDGEASAEESARIDAHLSACARCASHLSFLRTLNIALRSQPEAVPSPALFDRIAQATYARPTVWDRVRQWVVPAPARLALGAAVAVGIAALVAIPRFQNAPAEPTVVAVLKPDTSPVVPTPAPSVAEVRPSAPAVRPAPAKVASSPLPAPRIAEAPKKAVGVKSAAPVEATLDTPQIAKAPIAVNASDASSASKMAPAPAPTPRLVVRHEPVRVVPRTRATPAPVIETPAPVALAVQSEPIKVESPEIPEVAPSPVTSDPEPVAVAVASPAEEATPARHAAVPSFKLTKLGTGQPDGVSVLDLDRSAIRARTVLRSTNIPVVGTPVN